VCPASRLPARSPVMSWQVFEMLDSLPDVDLEAGIYLRREQIVGQLRLEAVSFSYQMRPREPVLTV
jgi:hypothetical protein